MGIPFRKLHGLGNDFVVVDGFDVPIPDALARSARDVCDRHLGVGADGVLLVARSDKADAAMRVINAIPAVRAHAPGLISTLDLPRTPSTSSVASTSLSTTRRRVPRTTCGSSPRPNGT